uniref:NADH-ubiquinone oxidoreductase chain 4 n=1 Tax=Uranoscopus cognatus TaxID=1633488 RepID=A0A4Y5ULZ2_9TELE|nr:NADH dehydrogenase subunit 4 [Uranoscopus cognatus]QDC33619.1 NADH dehydrogenase subunit 4 [Uranoscopus cognatus]QDC33632.1 NADH dehydrogenase subunit 4 [Uranoscopus cognatus]QDC33658.1 NADH dehydrogenase subunit 4 [Uranoscopus cognatus]
MMKLVTPTLMLTPLTSFSRLKWLWFSSLLGSTLIATLSLSWLKNISETNWTFLGIYLATDPLSAPFLVLSCWLLPLMILASQSHISPEPTNRQRSYIALMAAIQAFLILAFATTEIIMFYIMFEATLLPTLIIITRWGSQTERLNAGTYFLFYTLAGSLPLLVGLLTLNFDFSSLSLFILPLLSPLPPNSYSNKLWWMACLLAFLVKMPLYGVHLWLPKAHVEAPVAGSMILAAVLLKLGGYGMMRMGVILGPLTKELCYPLIALALWGVVMTASVCLTQTDLKSLIAYSSVSHMGLVAAGILIQTPWGFTGALILMIAHGLTSSALFCLANMNYERTHSRILILTRGLQTALPLMGTWWFFLSLANIALPPLPNLMGELIIISSLFNWSWPSLIFTGTGIVITAGYTLYMFLMTQRGPLPPHIKHIPPSHSREHLAVSLHFLPLICLMTKPEIMCNWFT